MADIVNPQITDAVTQANQNLDHAPAAVALGNLYMATAQALSNAANNATTNQQQLSVINQATTTQGVATLYGHDSGSSTSPQVLASDDLLGRMKTATSEIEENLQNVKDSFIKTDAWSENNSLHTGGFGEWSHAVINGFASALDRLNETHYRQSLRTLQIAATASVLASANKSPEQVQQYERLLVMIKDLV